MKGTIDIFTSDGLLRCSVPLTNAAKRAYELMKEDFIELRFTLSDAVRFEPGDFVQFTEEDGDPNLDLFKVTALVMPTLAADGGYQYDLKLEAYYYEWRNKLMKFLPQTGAMETSFTLTANLSVHAERILQNLAFLGYTYKGRAFEYMIDNTVEDKAKVYAYNNVSILDALTEIAQLYETEWWVTGNLIHFGHCQYGTGEQRLEYGVNVAAMTTSDNKAEHGTRLYVFGSDRNLPNNYRGAGTSAYVDGIVNKRLMLPKGKPYLDSDPEDTNIERKIERVMVFDEIYPRMELYVTAVAVKEKVDEITNDRGEVEKRTWRAYCVQTDDIEYQLEYDLEGEEQTLKFESGRLNGWTFNRLYNSSGFTPAASDIKGGKWDKERWYFEIERQNETVTVPNETLCPEVGDKFVLFGWDAGKISELGLIDDAEARLLEEGVKYIEKIKKDAKNYTIKLLPYFVHGEKDGRLNEDYRFRFSLGDTFTLVNAAYFEEGERTSRVIGFTYPLYSPSAGLELTLGESVQYSRLGELGDKVDALVNTVYYNDGKGGGSSVYVVGTGDITPLSNRNVLSSLRSKSDFLSAVTPDTSYALIKFLEGIELGNYHTGQSGARFTREGNLEASNALANKLTVRDEATSSVYLPDFTGIGWRVGTNEKLEGEVELDTLTVRKRMRIFELLIQKIRSTGGAIVVSPANGRIKEVTTTDDSYVIQLEEDGGFVAGDLIRCSTFTKGHLKSYWVKVDEVTREGNLVVSQSAFYDAVGRPEAGDELVMMGSLNEGRQGVVYISAAENGEPVVDVLDGISSANTAGCLRARFGSLEGIHDEWFGDDQPKGYGLYSDNAYLKGAYKLSDGSDVMQRFLVGEGKLESYIGEVRNDSNVPGNLLVDPAFDDPTKWPLVTSLVTQGGKFIRSGENFIHTVGELEMRVTGKDGYRCLYISQGTLELLPGVHFREAEQGDKLTLSCRVYAERDKTQLRISGAGAQKVYNLVKGWQDIKQEISWVKGRSISFIAAAPIYLALPYMGLGDLALKYETLFRQTSTLLALTARNFNANGTVKNESDIMVTPERAGLITVDEHGTTASIGTYTEGVIKLTGREIRLEGDITANGTMKIDQEGNIQMRNAVVTGFVRRERLVITAANYVQYTRLVGTSVNGTELRVFDLQKTGLWIYLEGRLPAFTYHFPAVNCYNGGGVITPTWEEDVQNARSLVGNEVMLYNHTGERIAVTGLKSTAGADLSTNLYDGEMLTARCEVSKTGPEIISFVRNAVCHFADDRS